MVVRLSSCKFHATMPNQTFQQELAHELLTKYNGDLSSLAVMFPSLRARTFFNDAIASAIDHPVWQPMWLSIDDIMEQASGLHRGERIRLISELYKVYVVHHPLETFDKFYFWGDMLISDFDMIDRYMIDATQLLRNIRDIKELETDVSYLTPEQLRIISFWRSIGDNDSLSEQKLRFLKIWNSLPAIYTEYRKRLCELKIAYPGMIYRTTAERIKCGEDIGLPKKHFIIAGFNALSKSEKILFNHIATSAHGADFYWDYDNYYTKSRWHEAGVFMRENIANYPASGNISVDNFRERPKQIESIACVSNVVQCKYVAKILESLPDEELDKRTAIVLTDESLLIPLLHSLPERVKRVNVTMGYPLKNSLVYSFVERIIELQAHSRTKGEEQIFYHVDVTGLLSHPYISGICSNEASRLMEHINSNRIVSISASQLAECELLKELFSRHTSWQELGRYITRVISLIERDIESPMQAEYLHIAYEEVVKLIHSIERCDIEMPMEVFPSLLRRHLQTVTIPYVGEPLEGIQIMGILETRNVDFKNVIILSMTDATFPGDKTGQSSFIPYNLRAAYGMPTPEEHEAMYAYYFYRIVQRAEHVSMLYCSRADDKSTGERSRYIYQLEYESPYPITKRSVGVDLTISDAQSITITKGERERAILDRYLRPDEQHTLSPTALFRYIECPLKFYLSSVAHLRTPDEVSDTIDALMFGNILHETMQELYTPLIEISNPESQIDALRKQEIVEQAVDKTIGRIMLGDEKATTAEFTGDTLLVRDIIIKYIIRGIMRYDKDNSGYTIAGLEDEVKCRYAISNNRKVNLSGRADRIDRLADGTMQIIDYKSGNTPHLEFNGMENLFRGTAMERVSNIFQTLLYSMMLHKRDGCEALPSLYFASKMHDKAYSPKIVNRATGELIERYSDHAAEFEQELTTALEELFDYETPFQQVEDVDMCKYCDYKRICRR